MVIKLPFPRAKRSGIMQVLKVVTEDLTFFTDALGFDYDKPTGILTGTTTARDLWGVSITYATNRLKYSIPYCAVEIYHGKKKEIYCFKPIMMVVPGEGFKAEPALIQFSKKGDLTQVEKYENLFSF